MLLFMFLGTTLFKTQNVISPIHISDLLGVNGQLIFGDIRTGDTLKSLQNKYKERAEILHEVLGIDLDWLCED